MTLYTLSDKLMEIAENLEAALAWEPSRDSEGNAVDDDGNIIDDVEGYREEMLAAWQGTLEAVEMEFDVKAGNIAACIKNLKAEAEMLHKEERALAKRRKVKEKALERLVGYLLGEMEQTGKRKIDTSQALITVRNNAESVQVDDEQAFIEWAQNNGHDDLLKYSAPEIRKTVAKQYIQGGGEIPCARLVRTQSLIVK